MADPQYLVPRMRTKTTCWWCHVLITPGTPGYMVTANIWTHPECADAWDRDPCRAETCDGPGHAPRGKTCIE